MVFVTLTETGTGTGKIAQALLLLATGDLHCFPTIQQTQRMGARDLHRLWSYSVSLALAYLALTGGVWAVLYRWFHYDKASVKWLINWHQGDVLNSDPTGRYIRAPFCVFIALGTLILFATGLMQFNFQSFFRNRNKSRRVHQWFALIAGFPLVMLALTGSAWAVAK
jgi:hypothetical protein